ncbi:thioredoxin family protein [Roseiconus nitratireducens]|uniref:Thioredoxin family protein n=1 Tax=Roseiconus nitratireducens TaxID=2605748 RepID=A0A5M6CZZ4_9BACT|nr:thioredoxin family protein [Roseiconus nitratireducens]KAA5540663.1 thioredoxin family protein [Roseiconus nitratireducens]
MKYLVPITLIAFGCIGLLIVSSDLTSFTEPGSQGAGSETTFSGSGPVDGLVLMKFGAPWCPPCRMIDEELKELAHSNFPARIEKINVDQRPDLAARYQVNSIPRLILMHHGRVIGDEVGFMSAEQLTAWVGENTTDEMLAAEPAPPPGPKANPFVE